MALFKRMATVSTVALVLASAATAQNLTKISAIPQDRQILNLHIGGRVLPHPMPGQGAAYEHQWPGVYFEGRFAGQTVFLTFSDPENEYRLIIDDEPPITINKPGEATFQVSSLADAAHTVRLEKVTESIAHAAAFNGFYIPKDETALTPPIRTRQIEFIGDSSMTGYGVRSTTRTCTGEEVRALTDTQADFAAIAAKHFKADYQINAYSGRGLIRNYGGIDPDMTMSDLYPYVLFDKQTVYENPEWRPQIIMIKLNADFATPLQPGEHWTSPKVLSADYKATFITFVKRLHLRYPKTVFLTWTPDSATIKNDPKLSAEVSRQQEEMRSQAKKIGIKRIGFVPFNGEKLEKTACDYHQSLQDQQVMALALIDYLDAHPDFWDGH